MHYIVGYNHSIYHGDMIIKWEGMKYIKPVEKSGREIKYPYNFYDRLIKKNGGNQYENLKLAHQELKHILSLVVKMANTDGIPLDEFKVESPQLMDPSAWGGYFGSPWDAECNARSLIDWFKTEYGDDFEFHVNANKTASVVIDFSPKEGPSKHDFSFRA